METNTIRYLYNSGIGVEMIFCGNSTISYPTHNHVSMLTIGVILNGDIILTKNQETKVYKQNETFSISPYVPHSILAHDRYTMLSLCIDKQRIHSADVTAIQKDIARFIKRIPGAEKINPYRIGQLLKCLEEAAGSAGRDFKNDAPYIHDLKRQLELYPEGRLTVGEMAQNAFISKYHFIRKFKAEVGLTPHQFQMQNRIRKAQRLLHESGTMTEVALTTGFCDQSHFIKQFEKYVGLPPLRYKASSGVI